MNDAQDHWYEMLSVRPTPENKGGRIYRVTCHDCGTTVDLPANDLTDEGMRKRLMRVGWEIGRRVNQHRCYTCIYKLKPAPAPDPKPVETLKPSVPFLIDAWRSTVDGYERAEFLTWFLQDEWGQRLRLNIIAGVTLDQAWDNAGLAARHAFVQKHALPPRQIPPPRLLAHWPSADHAERSELLDYLEQGHFLKERSLAQHWKQAPQYQRDAILKAEMRERKPWHAPVAAINGVAVAPASVAPNQQPAGTIRKSDFAKELGVNPATVSGYLRQGMPQRDDGYLDPETVRAWVKANIGQRGGARPPDSDTQDDTFDFELDDDAGIAAMSRKLFGEQANKQP
jgi:hypothetical protein